MKNTKKLPKLKILKNKKRAAELKKNTLSTKIHLKISGKYRDIVTAD